MCQLRRDIPHGKVPVCLAGYGHPPDTGKSLPMNKRIKQIMDTEMKKHAIAIGKDAGRLAEDSRALLAATADVAGNKIEEISNRVTGALKHDGKFYGHVRDRVLEGTRAVDKAIHTSPYQAAAIGIACGVLVGFFVTRKFSCDNS